MNLSGRLAFVFWVRTRNAGAHFPFFVVFNFIPVSLTIQRAPGVRAPPVVQFARALDRISLRTRERNSRELSATNLELFIWARSLLSIAPLASKFKGKTEQNVNVIQRSLNDCTMHY